MQPEAITLKQKRIFNKLEKFSEFYLVGGTALALQIGHRISVDFDLFTSQDLSKNLLAKVKRVFGPIIEIKINRSDQLSIVTGGIKIDFVKYPYPLIYKLINYQGVRMLSVKEIAASKAFTLGRRATFKDYVDLYFILKRKLVSLQEIIDVCKRKYKEEFNGRLFLEQLIFLEDVKEVKIEFLKEKVSVKQMADFFENEVRKIKL